MKSAPGSIVRNNEEKAFLKLHQKGFSFFHRDFDFCDKFFRILGNAIIDDGDFS